MNSNLRTINLASCNIGAAGALALWHYIKATRAPLEVVDIRDNNVGLGRVVEAMEQAVMQKPSIRAVGFDFSRDALIEASRLVAEVMSPLTPRPGSKTLAADDAADADADADAEHCCPLLTPPPLIINGKKAM
jgi:hypothetical protein